LNYPSGPDLVEPGRFSRVLGVGGLLIEFAFCSWFWLIGTKSFRVSSNQLFKQLAIDRIILGVT
jgi:hypothetical protein